MGKDLSEFVFLSKGATNIVESNPIPSGAFEQTLYDAVRKRINAPIDQGGFGGNESFGLIDSDEKLLRGSTPFLQFLVDETLEPYGARTALLQDLQDPRALEAVRGRHYVDARKIVLRGTNKGYEKNTPIFNVLKEHVGDLSTSVRVSGLRVVAWSEDETGYKLKLVPTGEFKVTRDDRLDSKWNEYKFTKTDADGMPVDLTKNGNGRKWFTSDQKLSRLYLNRNLYVISNTEVLAYSNEDGRVVVSSRVASAPNF
ncbi:MAG: hypothetical protein AABX10_04170 [Nanoarchaeota archaeon]